MFPLNRLYTFYASNITSLFPQHTFPAKVNTIRSTKQLTYDELVAK